jgi:hypothetical protein
LRACAGSRCWHRRYSQVIAISYNQNMRLLTLI